MKPNSLCHIIYITIISARQSQLFVVSSPLLYLLAPYLEPTAGLLRKFYYQCAGKAPYSNYVLLLSSGKKPKSLSWAYWLKNTAGLERERGCAVVLESLTFWERKRIEMCECWFNINSWKTKAGKAEKQYQFLTYADCPQYSSEHISNYLGRHTCA